MLAALVSHRVFIAIKPLLPYLLVTIAAVILYSRGYNSGVEDTKQEYEQAIQLERHRQIEANQSALFQAQKELRKLEELLNSRDETINGLSQDAANDPDAARRAINADSVRRIDRIR